MAELKTKPNRKSVTKYLDAIADEQKRKDCYAIAKMMQAITRAEPKMWGESMVGFGSYHYRYPSGHEGDYFLTGLSARKDNITVYVLAGLDNFEELLAKLGKHKQGKGCLYLKRLDDVDRATLKKLIAASCRQLQAMYG